MSNRTNQLLKELAGVAVFEALKSLAWGLVSLVVGFIGVHNLIKYLPVLAPYKIPLLALAIVLSFIIGIFIYERMTRNLPRFDRVNSDVRILEKTISYDYRKSDKIIYRRQYRLKILRNGVDKFTDRYRWSGSGNVDPKSAKPEHTIHHLPEEHFFRFFEIRFNHPFKRKSIVEADVIWELADPLGISHPVISATIYEPTDKLIMQVILPPTGEIPKAAHTSAPEIGAIINVETWEAAFSNGNAEIWPIDKPRLLHYYEVRWRRPMLPDNKVG